MGADPGVYVIAMSKKSWVNITLSVLRKLFMLMIHEFDSFENQKKYEI